jgi:LacI family transcriptional regulator
VRPPTLHDVAEVAGVHAATASRALNPETRWMVKAATVQKVLTAAESLSYQVNPIARSLKTAKSRTIGLVIPDLTNPLFPPIVRGIEDVLGPAGYNAWIVNTDNDAERERTQIESLRSRHVEGLIVATARLEHPLLKQLHKQGVNLVLINREVGGLEIPSVTADDSAGVSMAVEHLIGLGHRLIAHIAGPLNTSTGAVRSMAFRKAMSDHGLRSSRSLIVQCEYWSEADGADAMRALFDRDASFTAVVAGNDLIALGCYDVLAERGMSCPEEVSIVGFNDMPFLDKLRPPLTTIGLPHYEVGAEAARMLLSRIENPAKKLQAVRLPVTLVTRGSTASPRS